MPNTNNEKYKVDDAWPIEEPIDDEDCLKKLAKLFNEVKILECHGASKLKHDGKISVRSKFDICFSKNDNNKKNEEKNKEKKLLEKFIEKAFPFYRQKLVNLLTLLVCDGIHIIILVLCLLVDIIPCQPVASIGQLKC
jgi:hypothetical protein